MNLKRISAFLVALMMTLSVFAACGQVPDEHPDTPPTGTIDPSITVEDVTTPAPDTLPPETTPAPVTTAEPPVTTAEPVTTPAPETTPAPTTTKADPNAFTVEPMSATMYATISLNVRSGPSTDFDRIATLDEGEAVTVTGRASTGWYQVSVDGETGYVSNIYITDKAPAAAVTTAKPAVSETPSSSAGEVVDDEPIENPGTVTENPDIEEPVVGDWVDINGVRYMYNLFTDSRYQEALDKIAGAVEVMAPSVSVGEYLSHEEAVEIASNIVQMVGTGYCYFKGVSSVSGTTMKLTYFTDDYNTAQRMVSDLESAANKVVSRISGYSDYNKVKYIYEWLCTNNTYGGTYESSSYGSIVAGGANCLGYAEGTFYLLSKAGFDVVYATGYGTDQNHAWVKVKINGKWYNVDTTWGDPDFSNIFDYNYVCYDFLCVTDDYMRNTRASVTDLSKYYTMPSATSDDLNWYKLNNCYATSYSEVAGILDAKAREAVKDTTSDFVYVRIQLSTNELFERVVADYNRVGFQENILAGITSKRYTTATHHDGSSDIKKTRTITYRLRQN